MISIEKTVNILTKYEFGPYIGVPCSLLKPFINYVIDSYDLQYVKSTSEGEAVGIAAGTYLAGKMPVIMLQNSGLGNTVNPITSLTNIYKIPVLFIVSLRGEVGTKDEPQHQIMGRITSKLFDLVGIRNRPFPESENDIDNSISEAISHIRKTSLPYAFILRKGVVDRYELQNEEENQIYEGDIILEDYGKKAVLSRIDSIESILEGLYGDEPVISTTGMISRELFTLSDKDNHFYTVGSMGCASSMAFGISMYKKKKRIIILDGDGAVLMKMGAIATIGHYCPENIFHIVLDNESYDSTGGQATVSSTMNIAKIAACCGYRTGTAVYSKGYLLESMLNLRKKSGPHLIHVKVKKGHHKNLGRPTITPVQSKERFRRYLEGIE